MTSQPGQWTIAVHTVNNISRSNSNKAMKIGQLIETWEKFSRKIIPKIGGAAVPRWFSKKLKFSISLYQGYHLADYWNILKLSCGPLAFTSI